LTTLEALGLQSLDSFTDGIIRRLDEIYDTNVLTDEQLDNELEEAGKLVTKMEEVRRSAVEDSF
jgi:hypothetical protein